MPLILPSTLRSVFSDPGSRFDGRCIAAGRRFRADAQGGAQTHEDALKTPVGKFIQDVGDRAIAAIADKSLTVEQRSDKFRKILQDSFDLMTIGRFVIGRSWNAATPAQQTEYMRLFRGSGDQDLWRPHDALYRRRLQGDGRAARIRA